MLTGRDDKGREVENIHIELSVEPPGAKAVELDLFGDTPGEAAGFVFKANALGFEWGKTPASAHLHVDRNDTKAGWMSPDRVNKAWVCDGRRYS